MAQANIIAHFPQFIILTELALFSGVIVAFILRTVFRKMSPYFEPRVKALKSRIKNKYDIWKEQKKPHGLILTALAIIFFGIGLLPIGVIYGIYKIQSHVRHRYEHKKTKPGTNPEKDTNQPFVTATALRPQPVWSFSPEIESLLADIQSLYDNIIEYSEKELEESQIVRIRRELSKYMTFVREFTTAYKNLQGINLDFSSKKRAMDKILQALFSIREALSSMLNDLVETTTLDIMSSINVLEYMIPYNTNKKH